MKVPRQNYPPTGPTAFSAPAVPHAAGRQELRALELHPCFVIHSSSTSRREIGRTHFCLFARKNTQHSFKSCALLTNGFLALSSNIYFRLRTSRANARLYRTCPSSRRCPGHLLRWPGRFSPCRQSGCPCTRTLSPRMQGRSLRLRARCAV